MVRANVSEAEKLNNSLNRTSRRSVRENPAVRIKIKR